MKTGIFLSLGSNLGDRRGRLKDALRLLNERRVGIVRLSSVYRTEPVDFPDQPEFLNCVCGVRTSLKPLPLLRACMKIEERMGRTRKIPKGPRIIDIDILFFHQEILSLPLLEIPHPRLYERAFALRPLYEIEPSFLDPKSGRSVRQLLNDCADRSEVRKTSWILSPG